MKKFTLLSHTRLLTLLNLLPSTAIAVIATIFNDSVSTFPRLYPLIITGFGITLFLALFLFRVLYITTEEIRMIGPFSSKDKALIKKDSVIRMTLKKKGIVRIELLGNDDGEPIFDWVKEEDRSEKICVLRETVVGGTRTARRVLKFFDIEAQTVEKLLSEDCADISVGKLILCSKVVNEERTISINFTDIL